MLRAYPERLVGNYVPHEDYRHWKRAWQEWRDARPCRTEPLGARTFNSIVSKQGSDVLPNYAPEQWYQTKLGSHIVIIQMFGDGFDCGGPGEVKTNFDCSFDPEHLPENPHARSHSIGQRHLWDKLGRQIGEIPTQYKCYWHLKSPGLPQADATYVLNMTRGRFDVDMVGRQRWRIYKENMQLDSAEALPTDGTDAVSTHTITNLQPRQTSCHSRMWSTQGKTTHENTQHTMRDSQCASGGRKKNTCPVKRTTLKTGEVAKRDASMFKLRFGFKLIVGHRLSVAHVFESHVVRDACP